MRVVFRTPSHEPSVLFLLLLTYILLYSMLVGILFDVRGQRGLHVVRVVLDVVVLQDRVIAFSLCYCPYLDVLPWSLGGVWGAVLVARVAVCSPL